MNDLAAIRPYSGADGKTTPRAPRRGKPPDALGVVNRCSDVVWKAAFTGAAPAFRFCAAASKEDFSVRAAAGASLAPGRGCFIAAAALLAMCRVSAMASRRRLE